MRSPETLAASTSFLDALRVVRGQAHRDLAAERVADNGGAVDAEHIHQASNEASLLGERVVALLKASGVAEALEVDGDDAVVLGQLWDQWRKL